MLFKAPGKQNGSMIITMSTLLITLIGFAALVVDVGHLMIARNELQNAADAAALAGANCLNKGIDCTSVPSAIPSETQRWAIASTKANNAIGLNKADGATLVDATITTGYKNLTGIPADLQPITLIPTLGDRPGVMVSLSKASGQNGGPVQMLITAMFGAAALPITVNAVAVLYSPDSGMPHARLAQ